MYVKMLFVFTDTVNTIVTKGASSKHGVTYRLCYDVIKTAEAPTPA